MTDTNDLLSKTRLSKQEVSMFLRRAFLYLEDDLIGVLARGNHTAIEVKSQNLRCRYVINLVEKYFTIIGDGDKSPIVPEFHFSDLKSGSDALRELDTTRSIKSIFLQLDYNWAI